MRYTRAVNDGTLGELARAAWQAVSDADVDGIRRLVADDVVWHASGRGLRSGDFRGRDAILEYLAGIGDDADEFESELDDVLVGAHRTAILFRVSGRREGRLLEAGFVLLMRFEDNRIAEIWSVARDQHAVDEFWA